MAGYGFGFEQKPPDAASGGIDLKKRIGELLLTLRAILRMLGVKRQMEAIDLNKLVEPYFDSGLYLAVTRDNTSVVATGKTIQDAVDHAAAQGCPEPVIMRAPSREAMENSLHL
jgi:hypothetical protein